jgi:hypothetical protein
MVQEDMIKGRIAEAIVKAMFEDLGFEVIPYGYEHTCPTLAKRERLIKGEVKHHIRKAPDFIIVDNNGEANFIEVKYRAEGVFKKETDYPYRDCYIILLTKNYIGIEQYKNLSEEEITLTGANFNMILEGNFKGFHSVPLFKECDKEVILAYRNLLIKYMKD